MTNQYNFAKVIRSLFVIAMGLIAGFTFATGHGTTIYPSETSMDFHVPPPNDITDLISRSDLIVIGTVEKVVQKGYFQGYDEQGNFIESSPYVYSDESPVDPNVPFVDYEIKVSQVIRDDGTIKAKQPVHVRASTIHDNSIDSKDSDYASLGDKRLFFLSKNPDGLTFGPYYGAYGRLVIDKSIVTFSDSARTPVVFNDRYVDQPLSPEEFIKVVEKLVDN